MITKTVTHEIDGRRYDLPKLTPWDIITLGERAYELDRQRLERDLDAAGVDADKRLESYRELDEARGVGTQVVRYVLRPEGTKDAIELSISKMNGTAPRLEELYLSPIDALKLACDIASIELAPDGETEAEPENDDEEITGPRPTDASGHGSGS